MGSAIRAVGGRRRGGIGRGALVILGGALLLGDALLAGCAAAGPGARAPARQAPAPVTVGVGRTPVGVVLVDGAGITLYRYSGDRRDASRCVGTCARGWFPLAPGPRGVTAGPGVPPADLGVIARPGGGRQVTYRGWPLYTFVEDREPGEAAGQGVRGPGGVWAAMRPAGAPAPPRAPAGAAG